MGVTQRLKYDPEFYRLSYADISGLPTSEARSHFVSHGYREGRYCSVYHYLRKLFPDLAEAVDWRGLSSSSVTLTPLQLVQEFATKLAHGAPSLLDRGFYDLNRLPRLARHGLIHEWIGERFNTPNSRVLEIGSRAVCSDSLWTQYFPDCDYVGFDVLPGTNVDVVGDAHFLTSFFPPSRFDAVISFAVFEHLAMPWLVAEEIARVLKVGGVVAIETHFSYAEHELPWHFFQFNANALAVLFNEVLGFEILDKGMDSPMIGRFAYDAPAYLRGAPVSGLYCHSSIIAKKVRDLSPESLYSWRDSLRDVVAGTMYPQRSI